MLSAILIAYCAFDTSSIHNACIFGLHVHYLEKEPVRNLFDIESITVIYDLIGADPVYGQG